MNLRYKTYNITNIDKIHIELNNHLLIEKNRIKLSIGDKLKIGDIISKLVIDTDKSLLEVIYFKGFNDNHYKNEFLNKEWCLKC